MKNSTSGLHEDAEGNWRDHKNRIVIQKTEEDPMDDIEAEQGRWQQAIYDLLTSHCPEAEIDGGGCDSGDPLDVTLSEVSQALNYYVDKIEESLAKMSHRRCHDCDHVAYYVLDTLPYCQCEQCDSADTRLIREEPT